MSTIVEMNGAPSVTPHVGKKTALGIRARLMLGFIAIIAIFILAITITLIEINNAKEFTQKVLFTKIPTFEALLDLNNHIFQSELITQTTMITQDNKLKQDFLTQWVAIENSETTIDALTKNWTVPENVTKWQEVKSLLSELKLVQSKVLNTSSDVDKTITLKIWESEVAPLVEKIKYQLNTLSANSVTSIGLFDSITKQLHIETQEIIDGLTFLQITQYVITLLGIISAIIIALFTTRAIIKHITLFREMSGRIAAGDLTQTVTIESNDEIGQLGSDLNSMTKSLASMTREIMQSCHNIVTTLEEVRHAVDAQSAGASEQASSINEVTASLSEIEKSSAQTMEKAKSLGEAAERTNETGQLGLEAVEQSVSGMKEVREKVQMIAQTILELSNKTQQVGEITAVVNNLAQQSKMLALNASIEAAKAGEAGKGFAIVAVEVKTLAEQSEQATAQVQKILEDIRQAAEKAVMVTEEGTKGVDHGTSLVEQTGEAIRNLNDVIHETSIATQQIESAVRQEAAGIEQITAGMNEINQVTTSFVESVNQTTEAMDNLATIAKNLKMYVDTYKI